MSVRRMFPEELEAAVGVWRAANIARGAPHGAERTARIRAKLSASDALAFVALRPEIVGMALAEPGRLNDGEGGLDPDLLHISMVFVHPAAQRTGVGSSLVLHVLEVARSLGYQRAGVWTCSDNTAARKLYLGVGMAATGKSTGVFSGTQVQYGCVLSGRGQVPQTEGGSGVRGQTLPSEIRKPWGSEVWFAHTDRYAGKILRVRAGCRLSVQFHEEKDETSYVLSDRVIVSQGESAEAMAAQELGPGDSWRSLPRVVHTFEALEDAEIIEVSTPQLDDVVRLEDRYGRVTKTASEAG